MENFVLRFYFCTLGAENFNSLESGMLIVHYRPIELGGGGCLEGKQICNSIGDGGCVTIYMGCMSGELRANKVLFAGAVFKFLWFFFVKG